MASHLKENILARIQAKNLSINGLERKAGLKQSAVHNILLGRSKKPSAETLQAIAAALECTLDDLLAQDDVLSIDSRKIASSSKNSSQEQVILPLFRDACVQLSDIIASENIEVSLKDLLYLISESYRYAVGKHDQTFDLEFALWLLRTTLK